MTKDRWCTGCRRCLPGTRVYFSDKQYRRHKKDGKLRCRQCTAAAAPSDPVGLPTVQTAVVGRPSPQEPKAGSAAAGTAAAAPSDPVDAIAASVDERINDPHTDISLLNGFAASWQSTPRSTGAGQSASVAVDDPASVSLAINDVSEYRGKCTLTKLVWCRTNCCLCCWLTSLLHSVDLRPFRIRWCQSQGTP